MSNPFAHIEPYPGDPILSLMHDFQNDTRPKKVSLGIGLYFDEDGQIPLLESVRQAMGQLDAKTQACGYLPMDGLAHYRQLAQNLAFGAQHPGVKDNSIATIQTLGGSGALKVGADFIKHYFPNASIWLSNPSWENHAAIFSGSGFKINYYPYYSANSADNLCFADTLQTIATIPQGDVILLHASCHNPTGTDWSRAQWEELISLINQRELIVFFDMAYQGFGEGIDEDAWSVRTLSQNGRNKGTAVFLAHSFSKNFSLYGERVGALHVVCPNEATANNVLGQLKATVRRNYSSPPVRGASLVQQVLGQDNLRQLWEEELALMRQRIRDMRIQLHQALQARKINGFDFLLKQHGMFSYTGLSSQQVQRLREEYGVYLVNSGRMCISGLAKNNINYVADALAAVVAPTKTITKDTVQTGIPELKQPFSWAVKASGSMLFTAHGPVKADGSIDTGDIESQARLTFSNLEKTLYAAKGSLNDVTQVLIYTTAIEQIAVIDKVYREFFSAPWPNRAAVGVAALVVPNMKIEIVAYAMLKDKK